MTVTDTKQRAQAPDDTATCELLCESLPDSTLGVPSAVVERQAVRRDRRTGRYARADLQASPTIDDDARRSLGLETRFEAGNQDGRQHGVRALQTNGVATLPPELRSELEAFQVGLEADQGGAGELTTIGTGYVRRLTELEGCLLLLAADLRTRGLMTARGRIRNSYTLLLQSIDRWDRLAQRLGVARRAKHLPSLREYLELRADGHARDEDGHAAHARETTPDDAT